MRKHSFVIGLALSLTQTSAWAEPGLAGEVYSAVVDQGKFEAETRFGILNGGGGGGEAQLIMEASYGVTDTWNAAVLVEFERSPGRDWKAEAVAVESILELSGGPKDALRTAIYGEIEASLHGEGAKAELKGIIEYRTNPWNLRANLILERAFGDRVSHDTELGYALRAVREIDQNFEIGIEAFGDFGTIEHPKLNVAHYAGPVVATELHFEGSELELQIGYLFGYGQAEGEGQLRLRADWEFP